MIDSPMVKVAHVQCIIRLEGVSAHHIAGLNLLFNDRQKRLGFGVRNDGV